MAVDATLQSSDIPHKCAMALTSSDKPKPQHWELVRTASCVYYLPPPTPGRISRRWYILRDRNVYSVDESRRAYLLQL